MPHSIHPKNEKHVEKKFQGAQCLKKVERPGINLK